MPTDMLEDAILVAKKALDEFDFESQGVDVRAFTLFLRVTQTILRTFSNLL